MTNIIFIEGVSGVGKTTTTTLLYEQCRNKGYNVSCYLEGAPDNPLDPFNGTYPPIMPLSLFSKMYMLCWQDFARNQLKNDFMLILDGTLFHHQINDLIREYDAPDETIANHITALLHVIQHFNPIIFYLSSNDVGQRLQQARKSRGQSVPTKDKIAFWENRKRVDLYALAALSFESYVLNIDNDWDTAIETMIMQLDLKKQ